MIKGNTSESPSKEKCFAAFWVHIKFKFSADLLIYSWPQCDVE